MLDALDKAILNELGTNCRTSYQKIAEKHKISSTAVKKRVEKLIETGVLSNFVVEYNLAMIDGEFFMALIQTDSSVKEAEFIQALGRHPMIAEVGALAGGQFIVFGSYVGSQGLREVGHFLRSQQGSEEVEIHTLLFSRGKKIQLKRLHLRILQHLLVDPRMPVTEIAKKTGLAARTVSRGINEIIDSEAVRLSIRWNLNATDAITFLLKVHWDEKQAGIDDIYSWLRESFPIEFWEPLICASEPIMFPAFVVENLSDIERITNTVERAEFVIDTTTLIGKPSKSFPDLRRYRLEESIRDAGLLQDS
jgi:DNA-binding Lrp family transcriptional regulator